MRLAIGKTGFVRTTVYVDDAGQMATGSYEQVLEVLLAAALLFLEMAAKLRLVISVKVEIIACTLGLHQALVEGLRRHLPAEWLPGSTDRARDLGVTLNLGKPGACIFS